MISLKEIQLEQSGVQACEEKTVRNFAAATERGKKRPRERLKERLTLCYDERNIHSKETISIDTPNFYGNYTI